MILPQISAQALVARDKCERLFALQYGERLDWPGPAREASAYTRRGEAFHLLVHRHRLGLAIAPNGELADLWARFMASPYADAPGEGLWTEQALQFVLPGGRFLVRFDEIRREGDSWTILDWKTGPRSEDQLAAHWQTRLYRFALAHAGHVLAPEHPPKPDQITMIYWQVPLGKGSAFAYSQAAYQTDLDDLSQIAAGASRSFETLGKPQGDEVCRACRFDSYCHPRPAARPPTPALALPRFES